MVTSWCRATLNPPNSSTLPYELFASPLGIECDSCGLLRLLQLPVGFSDDIWCVLGPSDWEVSENGVEAFRLRIRRILLKNSQNPGLLCMDAVWCMIDSASVFASTRSLAAATPMTLPMIWGACTEQYRSPIPLKPLSLKPDKPRKSLRPYKTYLYGLDCS